MSKSIFHFILVTVVVLLLALLAFAWWWPAVPVAVSEPEPEVPVEEEVELEEEVVENLFALDEGARVNYGSNPMVTAQTDDLLTLAYEYRAVELKNAPQDKVRYVVSEDGLDFEAFEYEEFVQPKPEPLLMPDGTYRRYLHRPEEGGVTSESSVDGVTFTADEGLRYEVGEGVGQNAATFGVSTYFVDSAGGVVLLYNVTTDDDRIAINRAYAAPETDGMSFELVDEDILPDTLEYPHFADPHTVMRENGEIWLVIMNGPKTRMFDERANTLHVYVSRDDGVTFGYEGRVVSYEDFEEFEVWSLNDPKLVEFVDGTLRIYVAAHVPDEEMESGFRWDIVSLTLDE